MNKTFARRAIKAASAHSMQGSWLRSFVITLLSSLIPVFIMGFLPLRIPLEEELAAAGDDMLAVFRIFLPDPITEKTIALFAVTALLYLFVMCPFSVGVCRFFLAVARGEKGKLSLVFSPFTSLKTVFSSIGLNIIISAVSLLWSVVLLFIPSLLVGAGAAIGSVAVVALSTLLLIICGVFYLLWTSRYTFAIYVFAEGRSGGAWRSFRTAQKILRDRGGELMALRASYFGWDIISTMLVPVLTFVYNALFGTVYGKYLYYLRGEMLIGESETPPEI